MPITMKLESIHYNNIKNKKKLYETRIYDEKRQTIKLLEEIQFVDRTTGNSFRARITELSYYKNFKEALQEVGMKKVLPNARSLKEAVKIYESFPHDSGTYKTAAQKYGVLRMKFDLLG